MKVQVAMNGCSDLSIIWKYGFWNFVLEQLYSEDNEHVLVLCMFLILLNMLLTYQCWRIQLKVKDSQLHFFLYNILVYPTICMVPLLDITRVFFHYSRPCDYEMLYCPCAQVIQSCICGSSVDNFHSSSTIFSIPCQLQGLGVDCNFSFRWDYNSSMCQSLKELIL